MVNGEGVLVVGRDRLARVLSATSHERSLVATVKPMGYNYKDPNDVWMSVDTQDFRWSEYEVEGEEGSIRVELHGAEATADFILALINPFKKYQFSVWSSIFDEGIDEHEERVFVVYVADESKGLKIVDLAE
ncbi:MAG TPA: hypothetical protein VJZ51_05590 [Bacilli bacterium]|nr:hypothetical protein [Bacilli bacterium]